MPSSCSLTWTYIISSTFTHRASTTEGRVVDNKTREKYTEKLERKTQKSQSKLLLLSMMLVTWLLLSQRMTSCRSHSCRLSRFTSSATVCDKNDLWLSECLHETSKRPQP